MKTVSLVSPSPYALGLLFLGLWSSGAWAQPVEKDFLPLVPAPVVQEVAPIGVKGLKDPIVAGGEQTGNGEVAPVDFTVSAYKVAAALKKLRAREITPQEAWDSKALDVDDLIYFLDKGLDSWGGFFWEKDNDLRRALVALLVEHNPKLLEHPESLSPVVRLWLADYYENLNDPRCISLAESILNEISHPLNTTNDATGPLPMLFQTIERMGWYYDATNQNAKCAQTWLRMSDYCIQDGWWLGDSWIMAARSWVRDGHADKAQILYDQAQKSRDPKVQGMVIYDEASLLFAKDPTQARDLVLQSLPSLGQSEGRIGPLWILAQAQWKLEAWPKAEETLQQIIEACPKNPTISQIVVMEATKIRLNTLRGWKGKSFVLPLRDLVAHLNEDKTYHVTFYVQSFELQPIEVHFPNVEVHLHALTLQSQKRTTLGVLVSIYDISYSTLFPDEVVAFATVKDELNATQEMHLRYIKE